MVFVHNAAIPVDFALAINKIRNSEATADEWELLDKYADANCPILWWVASIVYSNEPNVSEDKVIDEVIWFSTELDKR